MFNNFAIENYIDNAMSLWLFAQNSKIYWETIATCETNLRKFLPNGNYADKHNYWLFALKEPISENSKQFAKRPFKVCFITLTMCND